jgi:predicted dehydrogenase
MNRRQFIFGTVLVNALARGVFADEPAYRACIIGNTGRGNYGHGMESAFQGFANISVAGLADPDEKGRAAAAKKSGAQRTYSDWKEMLEKEKPNLLSIGPRWVEQRVEMLTAAAQIGAHVYMEKPIALSLEDADTIVAAVEKAKIKTAVAHQMRLVPQITHLKKLIDGGLIGELLEVRTRGKEDNRSGGEDMMVLGTHCLYLMRYFAGEPEWCFARVQENGRDIVATDGRKATEPLGLVAGDTINATYAFANGAMGYFASNKKHKAEKGVFQCTLLGTKGAAQFTIDQDAHVFYLLDPIWHPGKSGAKWEPLPDAPGNDAGELKGVAACNQRIVADLLNAIKTGGESVASIHEARKTLEMIFAVYVSQLKGAKVNFPLEERKHPLREK